MLSHATLDHRISHGALDHGRKPGGNRIDDGLAFAAERQGKFLDAIRPASPEASSIVLP
jgi:hypothetical protein